MAVCSHLRNIWKQSNDETRCDFYLHQRGTTTDSPPTTVPLVPSAAAAVITQPIEPRTSLADLARREAHDIHALRQMRESYTILRSLRLPTNGCRDMVTITERV